MWDKGHGKRHTLAIPDAYKKFLQPKASLDGSTTGATMSHMTGFGGASSCPTFYTYWPPKVSYKLSVRQKEAEQKA